MISRRAAFSAAGGMAIAGVVGLAIVVDRSPTTSSGSAPGLPASLLPSVGPIEDSVAGEMFRLTIRSDAATYGENVPIRIRAEFAYVGNGASVRVFGAGAGIVVFSWEQLDGRLKQDWVVDDACRPWDINRGAPLSMPFSKSGSFGQDDPDAAFWRLFFADPAFRLPAGRYRVHAHALYGIGGCGSDHSLDASVVITVEKQG